MRALRLTAAGGPEALVLEEIETPTPEPGDALVRVHAAAITRDELEWPVDRLPAIPSYEVSGVVAAVGPEVGGVAVGDEVYSLTGFDRDGAAAEYAVVAADVLAPKPRRSTTSRARRFRSPRSPPGRRCSTTASWPQGERVLIHGAAGGVGHFAVQLAKARGAHVIAPVSAANVDRVRRAGRGRGLRPDGDGLRGRRRGSRPRLRHRRRRRGWRARPRCCGTAAASCRSPRRTRRPARSTSSSSPTASSSSSWLAWPTRARSRPRRRRLPARRRPRGV